MFNLKTILVCNFKDECHQANIVGRKYWHTIESNQELLDERPSVLQPSYVTQRKVQDLTRI